MRRAVDVVVALVWLVITAPLMLWIALLIRLESGGLVLYSPSMVGYRGRLFTLFASAQCP